MSLLNTWVRGLLHSIRLAVGFAVYLIFNKTPAFAYQSMVGLFCLTRGQSNDFITRAISFFDPPLLLSNPSGLLGDMADKKQLALVGTTLREQGYCVFQNRLPADLCDRLLTYATTHTCTM